MSRLHPVADRYPGRRYQRVAADIFARVDQATPTAVPERIRYEIVNHQARTAVSLRDLDSFELFITRSIDGVVLLRSKQRQKEMLTALQYAMETWPHERRLRVISEQVRPAITAFAGTEPPGMEA